MENKTESRKLALTIVEEAHPEQLDAIQAWAEGMLQIRLSNLNRIAKARAALTLTARSKVILPILKLVVSKAKRLGWDDRNGPSRWGLAGAATALAIFGTQGAGIAALGTAVGVPLWVVFGAGASFLGVLLDEIANIRQRNANKAETSD